MDNCQQLIIRLEAHQDVLDRLTGWDDLANTAVTANNSATQLELAQLKEPNKHIPKFQSNWTLQNREISSWKMLSFGLHNRRAWPNG